MSKRDGGKRGRPRDVTNEELLSHLRRIQGERFTLNDARDGTPFSSKSQTRKRLNEFIELGLLKQHDLGGSINQYSLITDEGGVVSAVDQLDQNARAEDVADVLDCELEGALIWLRVLENDGILASKPVGDGARAWSVGSQS